MENYILRKYEDIDYEFVYEVKKNAYKKYVEQCWGKWDDVLFQSIKGMVLEQKY